MSSSQILPEDDAAIGYCVRCFGALEHVVGGLIIDLRAVKEPETYADPQSAASRRLEKDLKGSLSEKAKLAERELSDLFKDKTKERATYSRLFGLIGQIVITRNLMMHGGWSKPTEDVLLVKLWSRETLPALRTQPPGEAEPDWREWSRADLLEIGRSTARIVTELREMRRDISSLMPDRVGDFQ